jgi:protoheme IX farnesyltransferase
MTTNQGALDYEVSTRFKDYIELCKPKVVLLMLLTTLVGMALSVPGAIPLDLLCFGLIGVGLCAGSAAAVNHVVDRRIDAVMFRTHRRPIAKGKIPPRNAILFSIVLGVLGMGLLFVFVNALTAWLTFVTLIGYAGIYTGYLKRATPQNIVIGGLAGAAPPLLGWTAVTGEITAQALLLVLIIFTWTPPHFWALAIYRYEDYKRANIPMLPVTHGLPFTKLNILLYTILLIVVTALPFAIGMSGLLYFVVAMILGARFLQWSIRLKQTDIPRIAMQTFRFSIVYLMLLFSVLLVDHYLY